MAEDGFEDPNHSGTEECNPQKVEDAVAPRKEEEGAFGLKLSNEVLVALF